MRFPEFCGRFVCHYFLILITTIALKLLQIYKIMVQIVGERCTHVEKFVIPKELTYRFKIDSCVDLGISSLSFDQLDSQLCDSEWLLPDTADLEEKHPKQYVPQRNWQKLSLSSGIGHCRGRGTYDE